MNDIGITRLNSLNRFLAGKHPPITTAQITPKTETTTSVRISETTLPEVIGKALVAIQQSFNEPLESPEAALITRLKALYLSKFKEEAETTFEHIVESNLSLPMQEKADFLNPEIIKTAYANLFWIQYNAIRRPSNPYRVPEDPNTFPDSELPNIEVINKDNDRYIHHLSIKTFGRGEIIRYSLNVNVKKELIKELDKFIDENKGVFKFSKHPANRHDPITLYFNPCLDSEQEIRLAKLIQPYVRGDDLIGHGIKKEDGTIFNGIKKEVDPSRDKANELSGECFDLDPLILKALKIKRGEENMSVGEYAAIKNMIAKLKEGLPEDIFLLD